VARGGSGAKAPALAALPSSLPSSQKNKAIHTHKHTQNSKATLLNELLNALPHEKLHGITWVSNPATRKDLVARTWGVILYYSEISVLFEIMVQIKQKRGTGVKIPSPRNF